jgi:two-component system sensor histidine kinase DegS
MSDKLLTALENERRYVARELHDGVAQTTLQLGLQAGICRKLLEHNKLELLADELAQLEERIQVASNQMRELIADMRPPKVDPDANLDTHLQHIIDIHLERGGPAIEYGFQWSDEAAGLSDQQRLALARVVQEALLNIRKHARAETVRLKLGDDEEKFYVIIADDGRGFDLAEVEARPTDNGGAGLANLRARVEASGGRLTVDSGTNGTNVTVTLPK